MHWSGNECEKNDEVKAIIPSTDCDRSKPSDKVERFTYLDNKITNDVSSTREIKFRIAMGKAAFNKEETLFTSKFELNLRKKLVKCYIWSIAFYGAEIWTLRNVDKK